MLTSTVGTYTAFGTAFVLTNLFEVFNDFVPFNGLISFILLTPGKQDQALNALFTRLTKAELCRILDSYIKIESLQSFTRRFSD